MVSVHLIASGEEAALHWHVSVDGEPCRFLVYARVLVGEREYESAASFTTDGESAQFVFDPNTLWGERFPDARFDFFASTPGVIETMGGDELLYSNGAASPGNTSTHVAFRTHPTRELAFTVTGSLSLVTDEERKRRDDKYRANPVIHAAMLASARNFWRHLIGGARVPDAVPFAAAHNTVLPWLAHNALIHLSAPHGLEQFSGGAWGTRDVCQGPIESLLALGHGGHAKQVLARIFAQQYAPTHVDASGHADLAGDWPQWFMFEPYAFIQGAPAHGDIIVWPLKALCDYIEATGDAAILDEPVAWRRQEKFDVTERTDTYSAHIEAALQTIRSRFIPGTHLLRLGEGDWNDALQLADPALREYMVSSWTVALLHHQLKRYAEILRGAGQGEAAGEVDTLAASIRTDYRRHLMADGVVAGYGLFSAPQAQPQAELLIHPRDTRTGISYSLIAMTSAITGGLLTPEEAAHHLKAIRQHLAYPDGVRLMDRMMPYSGGLEKLFRRAESAAFVGREIALMYAHAHLRYLDVLAEADESGELADALAVVNPILVTERLAHATLRQRNAFFSSSDAAFPDRYAASAGWELLHTGEVPVDGGWRIYSSGPGLFLRLLARYWATVGENA
jgi:cellobiose phosphorylase